MRIPRLLLATLLLAVLGGAALAYRLLTPLPVRSARVLRGSVIDAVYASGQVEARDRIEVKARVAGPIGALHVRVGQAVRKGQRLASIDAPILGLEVARGRVELNAARERQKVAPQVAALEHQAGVLEAQLLQARADLTRVESLLKTGAATAQELERARIPVSTLALQIAAYRAQQQDARIALRTEAGRQKAGVAALRARASDVEVLAPMNGVVLARHVDLGEIVSAQQNLLRIGDLDHLWIEARVDEADIGRVRDGMKAALRLYAFPGRTFVGKVVRVLPDADRARKSFEVDIELTEALEGLRPGLTVEANLIIKERAQALLVPADAVREQHVWVIRDGRLLRRVVTLGMRDLVQVEVQSGLAEGDAVALEPEERLREGLAVSAAEGPRS